MKIDTTLTAQALLPRIHALFRESARTLRSLFTAWDPARGTPVFTVDGSYTSRGWTEWTHGFMFGSAILQYDATGEKDALALGREGTVRHMATHVSHVGVHDHGFNNVSTYGNLLRLMREGRIEENAWEKNFYELALKVSGAIQAARWSDLGDAAGYIYSFNGPHSLFADTVRSLRSLAIAHRLGHVLMGEKDRRISLLERLIRHAETTSACNVYFGKGRDLYDVRGRVAHESIFNLKDGSYRCPSSQQGYSPFSTWTRGLAWIVCGYAEELEFLASLPPEDLEPYGGRAVVQSSFRNTAEATADFYIAHTPSDGIPYWDTGAPGLAQMKEYLNRPADPFNDVEPVDSSAAVIAAQGLMRLGKFLRENGSPKEGGSYEQAGLTIARAAFSEPYLNTKPNHQGLILHSVYHRPNGWDHIPPGRKIPCGEATMWGDYHARELALMILRKAEGKPLPTFFGGIV